MSSELLTEINDQQLKRLIAIMPDELVYLFNGWLESNFLTPLSIQFPDWFFEEDYCPYEEIGIPCIYFIVANETQCLYVGQTRNLTKRFKYHHRQPDLDMLERLGIKIDIFFEEWFENELISREKYWIEKLNPTWNRKPVINK